MTTDIKAAVEDIENRFNANPEDATAWKSATGSQRQASYTKAIKNLKPNWLKKLSENTLATHAINTVFTASFILWTTADRSNDTTVDPTTPSATATPEPTEEQIKASEVFKALVTQNEELTSQRGLADAGHRIALQKARNEGRQEVLDEGVQYQSTAREKDFIIPAGRYQGLPAELKILEMKRGASNVKWNAVDKESTETRWGANLANNVGDDKGRTIQVTNRNLTATDALAGKAVTAMNKALELSSRFHENGNIARINYQISFANISTTTGNPEAKDGQYTVKVVRDHGTLGVKDDANDMVTVTTYPISESEITFDN